MRALSESVVEAIRQAYELTARRGGERRIENVLDVIVASGEWLALPRLVPLVLDDRAEVALVVARAVAKLKATVPVGALPVLDRSFRELSPWGGRELMHWHELQPSDLRRLAGLPDGNTLVQLATFHPNGHVREAAVKRSNLAADGTELPFYLLRLNDWVTPVRDAAAAAVRARLKPDCADQVVAALPIIDASKRWGRIEDTALLGAIEDLLTSPEAAPALRAGLTAEDRLERRACFRRAVSSHAIPSQEVLAAALNDGDAWLRLWACRRLCDRPEDGFDRLARQLLRDPLGTIRARALATALERGIHVALEPLLCDPNPAVRNLVQAQLLADDIDVVARYRALLGERATTRLAAALAGLAESSDEADAALIRPFLAHEAPRVRRAALHALAALRVDDVGDLCLRALRDTHPSVTHAGRDLLRARVAHVTGGEAWTAFDEAAEHGKKDALAVLACIDHWQQLGYLVRAAAEPAGPVLDDALARLRRWITHSARRFTTPTSADLAAADAAMVASDLPATLRVQIEHVVGRHRHRR